MKILLFNQTDFSIVFSSVYVAHIYLSGKIMNTYSLFSASSTQLSYGHDFFNVKALRDKIAVRLSVMQLWNESYSDATKYYCI